MKTDYEDFCSSLGQFRKHDRAFINKHPLGNYFTDEEKVWCAHALIKAGEKSKDAYKELERLHEEYPEAEIPIRETERKGEWMMRAFKRDHKDLMLKEMTNKIMWQFYEMMDLDSVSNAVKVEIGKYLWDRDEGKPVARTELSANVNVTTLADLQKLREEQKQQYQRQAGEWYKTEEPPA